MYESTQEQEAEGKAVKLSPSHAINPTTQVQQQQRTSKHQAQNLERDVRWDTNRHIPIYKPGPQNHEGVPYFRASAPYIKAHLRRLGYPFCFTAILVDDVLTVYVIIYMEGTESFESDFEMLKASLASLSELPILLCSGDITFGTQTSAFGNIRKCQKYTPRVLNGASIGSAASPTISGSLGFYVIDETGTVYGLSAGHNFAVGHPLLTGPITGEKPSPFTANQCVPAGTEVFQPSDLDIQLGISYENEIMALQKERLKQWLITKPAMVQGVMDEIDACEKNIAQYEELLSDRQRRYFGQVTQFYELDSTDDEQYAITQGESYLFDYALFRVALNRLGHNAIAINRDGTRIVADDIDDFSNLDNGTVEKWRRTTDWTEGSRQGIETYVGNLARFPGKHICFESVLDITPRFCGKGDSGAGVASKTSCSAVGIVQGQASSNQRSDLPQLTFIANLRTILKRLEEKHGLKLQLLSEEQANVLYSSAIVQ